MSFSNFLSFFRFPLILTEVKLRTLGENLKKTIASKEKIDVNLNARQQAGLRCLEKRVKNQEIVVFKPDKSGRFSVDTPTNYLLAGEVHTANDETITRKKCLEIEDKMNAHSNAWMRMLNTGALQNDRKRVSDKMVSKNCPPSPFYTSRKDHKEIATQAPNKRLSHVMNLIVGEVWKNNNDSVCLSTEEMLAEIDVKALYPSLDIDFIVAKVCEDIFESFLNFEGLWYEEIALYVAIHRTPEDLRALQIDEICPTRTNQSWR